MTLEEMQKLEEIQAICIGADSPDAITLGEKDPKKELELCRKDISAISNIVEGLLDERKTNDTTRTKNSNGNGKVS